MSGDIVSETVTADNGDATMLFPKLLRADRWGGGDMCGSGGIEEVALTVVFARELMWLISAATPGVPWMS